MSAEFHRRYPKSDVATHAHGFDQWDIARCRSCFYGVQGDVVER